MILSVSRRTDIPAFYSDWFFRRIKEGSVCVRNPMNIHQISRLRLSPEVVDCIVFWSKNPEPMLKRLDELSDYDYYFQFTINDYGKETEPFVPELEKRIDTFKRLSEKIGREKVIWRYDPIIFTDNYTPARHIQSFSRIASQLKDYTEKCVFSFVDIYPSKNSRNLSRLSIKALSAEKLDEFSGMLSKVAKANNLVLATCAEAIDLSKHGIEHNSCIDKALIERITGCRLKVGADGQRQNCGCVKCDDIGSYDTCTHGCTYCYANYRKEIVWEKAKQYDISSPLLCDRIDEEKDKITDRPLKSYKDKTTEDGGDFSQLSFF
ncbi:MAG: DUF1848 domain-containing protein [Ruminiclostridium sp.]